MRQQLLWRHGLKPGSLPLVVASARAKKKPPGEIESKIRVLQFLDGKRSLPRSPSYGRGMLRVKQRWSDSKGRRNWSCSNTRLNLLPLACSESPSNDVGGCLLPVHPSVVVVASRAFVHHLSPLPPLLSHVCACVLGTAFWHEA